MGCHLFGLSLTPCFGQKTFKLLVKVLGFFQDNLGEAPFFFLLPLAFFQVVICEHSLLFKSWVYNGINCWDFDRGQCAEWLESIDKVHLLYMGWEVSHDDRSVIETFKVFDCPEFQQFILYPLLPQSFSYRFNASLSLKFYDCVGNLGSDTIVSFQWVLNFDALNRCTWIAFSN